MTSKSLQEVAPEISKQWHPVKNGNLTPKDVPARSKKNYWWVCEKNAKHEWEASTDNRVRGTGCPYCAGRKVLKEESFGTLYPEIAEEWDSEKNKERTPFDVTVKSNYRASWKCKNDSDHCWQTPVSRRTSGSACPYCVGQKLCKKKSLAAVNPELAREFHPTLNGNLLPDRISIKSDKSVYWQCQKSTIHSPWKAPVKHRHTKDAGCPECRLPTKPPKEKSLAYLMPALAAELHPTLNNGITGYDVTPGSGQLLTWVCPINSKHIWKTRVVHRTSGHGCKYCSTSVSKENRRIFSELNHVFDDYEVILEKQIEKKLMVDIAIPELKIAIEWDSYFFHKDRGTIDSKKTKRIIKNGFICIRLRAFKLPFQMIEGCKVISHSDKVKIGHVQLILKLILETYPHLNDCPKIKGYLRRKRWATTDPTFTEDYRKKLPIPGKSLEDRFPEHCKFWHPTKNGKLLPREVFGASHQTVHWRCVKNEMHEWECGINTFTRREPTCLYCNNLKPSMEYNLSSCHPNLLIEWAYDLNINLDPSILSPGTGQKVWWRCAKRHVWEASVHNRAKGNGCPFCCGKKVSPDNCLAVKNVELSKQWHPTLNGDLTPNDFTPGSHKKIWWQCSINPKHIWESTIKNRSKGRGCPQCAKMKRKKSSQLSRTA